MSFDQVQTLWRECVCNNITAAERETFFEWFSLCITDDGRPSIATPFHDDVLDKAWLYFYFSRTDVPFSPGLSCSCC